MVKVDHAGSCKICGKPTKRDHTRARVNRTCSPECLSKFMSENSRSRYRNSCSGMRATQADDYLDLIERAENLPAYERENLLKRARELRDRVAPLRFWD